MQVTNLIRLFYSRKINLNQQHKPEIPYKVVSDEYSREGNWEVRRQNTLPQLSLNLPMHYTVTDTERGSNQVNSNTLQPQPSHSPHFYSEPPQPTSSQHFHSEPSQPSRSQHFYSEPVDSSCSSLFVPNDCAPFRPFSTGKQFSTTENMYYNKPLPQESDRYMPKFDSVAVPYSTGPHHYSSPNVTECMLSCDNMIPRQIKIQEPHVFESLRIINDDHHRTAVLQHTSVPGAQPDQLFKFPDYIPLPEDRPQRFLEEENHNSGGRNFEYVSSAAFRSCIPSICKETSEDFNIDDDKELKVYPRLVSDDYPVVSRVSVFSRLSRGQNVRKCETPESPSGSSLDQLLNMLDSRRERWSATTEAFKQSGKRGGGDRYDRPVSTEFFNQDKFAVQPVEQSKADENECVGFDTSLDYDQGAELSVKGSFDLPFYNFRRRNMSQKFESRDDLNTGSKRRRFLRPSLHGEEQNAKEKPEANTLTLKISEGEKENKATCPKSELDGESVSSFVGPETEPKTQTQAISDHERESKVSGIQTHENAELKIESVSSLVRPEAEVIAPKLVISELEGESVKANPLTSEPETEDYIPLY